MAENDVRPDRCCVASQFFKRVGNSLEILVDFGVTMRRYVAAPLANVTSVVENSSSVTVVSSPSSRFSTITSLNTLSSMLRLKCRPWRRRSVRSTTVPTVVVGPAGEADLHLVLSAADAVAGLQHSS